MCLFCNDIFIDLYRTHVIYITNRINVKINKHTNNYKTIDWININYFINALLQNCLHSKFRYHIFAS